MIEIHVLKTFSKKNVPKFLALQVSIRFQYASLHICGNHYIRVKEVTYYSK